MEEIADYLGRDVSTVRRWEDEKALPVHRLPSGKRQAVYAYRSEIEAWLGSGAGHKLHGPLAGIPPQNGENPAAALATRLDVEPALRPHEEPVIQGAEGRMVPPPIPGTHSGRRVSRYRVPAWLAISFSTAVLGAATIAYLVSRPLPAPKIQRTFQVTNDGREKHNIATDGVRVYDFCCRQQKS